MTPQEKQLLQSLANRIAATQMPQKDPEADALIRQTIGSNPDALYILTQTVLIQEMALNQANQRLHELQEQSGQGNFLPNQPPQPSQHQSFLSRLFGPTVPQQQAPPPPPPAGGYYQSSPYQPQYQYAPPPSGAGSFLRSAAITATGVAAGALAFEGIEDLIGGHHGYGGFGGGFGGDAGFGGGAPQETIINNYYDDSGNSGGGDRFADQNASDNRTDDNTTDADIQDSSYDSGSDSSSYDDNSTDV